ncbi:MAG: hypothetical protein R3192_17325 [Woeseiaceae bacterium]|nr:hypothetical protein [Woeseiaceae bacterium]
MPRATANKNKRRIAATIVASVTLAGCETSDNWLKRWTDSDREAVILGAPGAHEYLHEIYQLSTSDEERQAQIFANAKTAAERTPGTSTQLRYALLLATPGHAGHSDIQAQTLLDSLLGEAELMTPAENALAVIHRQEVEERLALVAEIVHLREQIAQVESEPPAPIADDTLERRVANVEAENRRLRRLLAESEAKLEALSDIERSLREQSSNGEPR